MKLIKITKSKRPRTVTVLIWREGDSGTILDYRYFFFVALSDVIRIMIALILVAFTLRKVMVS